MAKDKTLFREEALKHASSPQQLDQLIRIVPYHRWIWLSVLWGLIIAVLLWGFFGRIPFRVAGDGLLLAKNGSVYAAVAAAEPGRIKEILVKAGVFVEKGQLVARLQESALRNDIKTSQAHWQELQDRYEHLQALFDQQIAEHRAMIRAKNHSLEIGLAAEMKSLKELEELFKMVKHAYEQQLEPKRFLTDTASNYYAQQAKVEAMRQEMLQNEINLSQFIAQKQDRLREMEFSINDQQHELDKLKKRLQLSEQVKSPVSGVVTAIAKNIGDLVNKGDVVLRIANVGDGLDAIIFVAAKDGKNVKPGMKALVSPTNIKKEEYGSIRAIVNTVSGYPVTREAMMAILHNESLVNELSKNSAPIAVRMRLQADKQTPSGLAWSSSRGPGEVITPGTAVVARITIKEKAPLRIIMPMFKHFWSAAQ